MKNSIRETFSSLIYYRNFRLFFTGLTLSQLGTNIQDIAQTWLMLELTHSTTSVAIFTACLFAPYAILGLFVGPLTERLDPRITMLWCQGLSMLLSLSLALLYFWGKIAPGYIYVTGFLRGLLIIFNNPMRHLLIRHCVEKEDIPNAVGMNAIVFNLSRSLGPAIGGMMLAWYNAGYCFLINSVSYIPILWGLSLINTRKVASFKKKMTGREILTQLWEGLCYIKKGKMLFPAFVLLIIISIACINFNVLLPILCNEILHVDQVHFGLVTGLFGFGAFTGALNTARLTKPVFKYVLVMAASLGATFILITLFKESWIQMVLIVVLGAFYTNFTTTTNSFIQLNSANKYQGRIISLYSYIVTGSNPIGALFIGLLLNSMGAPATFIIPGIIALIATGGIYAWEKRSPASIV